MKRFKYEFETNDDFEIGCCYDCPLHDFAEDFCEIGYGYQECPLKETKDKND